MPDRDRLPSAYFRAASRASRAPASHLISIRLPDDLVQRLAVVGNEEGLSMSDTIRLVLERGLTAARQTGTSRRTTTAGTATKRKKSSR
jgi:hypothetical protein